METVCDPPTVGIVFPSLDDLDNFFRRYAKHQGFRIVKAGGAYKQLNGKITNERRNFTWKCESGGKPDARVGPNRKLLNGVSDKGVHMANRKTKKVGCPVMLHAKFVKEGEWQIRSVVLEHKYHEPIPSNAKYISMFHRDDLNALCRRLFQHHDEGVSISQIHGALATERNGVENFPVSKRQLRNIVDKDQRLKMMDGDANAMSAYFHRMSMDNQKNFHLHRLDDEERLKDVMWVDAWTRAAFAEFRDVVCFDSTYLTNKYLLPFANFVGVNHHGQFVLLGCALISHEDAEKFEWLFTNWISCMGGKAPDGILTDQDVAMKKAIAKVMPQTRHRWCLWHILNKLPLKLGGYDKYDEIKKSLQCAIYDNYTPQEFEETWNGAIDEYFLGENAWLAVERRAEDEKQVDADSASVVGSKEVDDKLVDYTIEDRVWVRDPNTHKDIPTRRKRRYEVKYNVNTNEAWCVCKSMESAGIICRNTIVVFEKDDVENVHDMFILRRWCKDVLRKHTMVKVAYHDPSKIVEVKRYDRMMVRFEPICLT
ncbi:Protein FAR1-RELATED SEQUENCE 6 [Bienertia sinuspersici]